ncbi:hypothetical protein OO013_10075 [Mangrovivirga sp. M17]|uniref:Glycoside hydrolase n=1 Tax=Mangrovivirga halotolerans TaxID=2993936 RepID=A0ABT3RR22_9BACT|nr:hypothetical protein [Mangrovivirga halotolerans]MCX2744214.1 hypothetical protein [Mangrovivirga halotolerans]
MLRILPYLVITVCVLLSCTSKIDSLTENKIKIRGVNLVAPPEPFDPVYFDSLVELGVSHVAVVPFGFSRKGSQRVIYNHEKQWWGEKDEGVFKTIELAHEHGLQVLLKPHMWISGEGWPGDFFIEDDFIDQWFNEYNQYILHYANIADSMNVEMLSIGNELRKLAINYPAYWKNLIEKTRAVYKGKLIYSANWDNYTQISFWQDLDYVGINAYFPLPKNRIEELTDLESIKDSWSPWVRELNEFNSKVNKPIIFTEFGYMSKDDSYNGHWLVSDSAYDEEDQALAYDALLSVFRSKDWWNGGYSWKYFMKSIPREEYYRRDAFIFQGKKAEKILKKHYSTGY